MDRYLFEFVCVIGEFFIQHTLDWAGGRPCLIHHEVDAFGAVRDGINTRWKIKGYLFILDGREQGVQPSFRGVFKQDHKMVAVNPCDQFVGIQLLADAFIDFA